MNKTLRKLVVLCTLCGITLVGCGNNYGTDGEKGSVLEKGKASYTKDDLNLNFSATIDEQTIIDEKGIKVTAKNLTYSNYSADLELTLENNTNEDYEFYCGTAGYNYNSVNGYSMSGGYFNQDVAAGSSETVKASFSLEDLTILGFKDIAVIGLGIKVEQGLDVYYESGEVEIKTSAADSYDWNKNTFIEAMDGGILPAVYEYVINKTEKDVYSNGDISIESLYVFTNRSGAQSVFAQIYNSGSKKAYLNSRDIYVNGELVREGYWSSAEILPGKRGILSFDLSRAMEDYENSEVAENGADSIEFTFRLNDELGMEVWSTPIKITIR